MQRSTRRARQQVRHGKSINRPAMPSMPVGVARDSIRNVKASPQWGKRPQDTGCRAGELAVYRELADGSRMVVPQPVKAKPKQPKRGPSKAPQGQAAKTAVASYKARTGTLGTVHGMRNLSRETANE